MRANLQPLRGLPEQLRKTLGLPALGFTVLDPAIDIYRRARDLGSITAPTTALPSRAGGGSASKVVDFGADDVLAGGFRWRLSTEVDPSPSFRRLEVGYVEEFGLAPEAAVRVGARGVLFRLSDQNNVAFETYGMFVPLRSDGEALAAFALSYSYNVPDTQTFLPIPRAHVFGLQAVFGAPETSRPLVPLIRAVEERKKKKDSGGDP